VKNPTDAYDQFNMIEIRAGYEQVQLNLTWRTNKRNPWNLQMSFEIHVENILVFNVNSFTGGVLQYLITFVKSDMKIVFSFYRKTDYISAIIPLLTRYPSTRPYWPWTSPAQPSSRVHRPRVRRQWSSAASHPSKVVIWAFKNWSSVFSNWTKSSLILQSV
jgi:hypothetical protein